MVAQVLFDACHGEDDATPVEFPAQRVHRVQRGDVDLDVGLGVEDEPPHRGRPVVGGGQRPAAEVLGVGEEQRGVVAVHHQAGNGAGLRVVVDVVHAGQTGYQSLDRVVRSRHPAQQFGHRQRHGHQHAVQDVQREDAGRTGDRQHQFPSAEGGQPAETRQVDHPHGGEHHDGTEHRHRQVSQQRAEEKEHREDARAGCQRVHLGASARRPGERGPAGAAADGEPGKETGAEIRAAQGEQLLVGVEALPAALAAL